MSLLDPPGISRVQADVRYQRKPSLSALSLPLYIAHRGSAALYPEESAIAYNLSLADGEQLLECDVQLLSDGVPGLMHDSTVDRTTTGTGNVNTFNTAAFKALTMDASVWLGSNYGDGNTFPMIAQDWIDAYKTRGVLFPEDKDLLSMTALVKALVNSGVSRDGALIQCAQLSNLAASVYAGYPSLALTTNGLPTAAQIVAANVGWVAAAYAVGDSIIQSYVAAGLKTLLFTVNRRYIRDKYLPMGVAGFFCDDPAYMRRSVAMRTTDAFGYQTWFPGMLAHTSDAGLDLPQRGLFSAPNYWGYTTTVAGFYSCLQGYLCPVAAPTNFTLQDSLTIDGDSATDRWSAVFISTDDQPYTNGSPSPCAGYLFMRRMNGTIAIFRQDAGAGTTLLAQQTGSLISLGTETTYRISVTPTTLKLDQLNSGGSVVNTVSATDSTYRGGYIHLGRNGLACRFRNVRVL